ncbi:MAG: ABC transporter ATP-binding protein/permease [Lachnospiraceae bacterium]|nr:ABC transporter ATP-binding protein/permease [Lachnospiraceae bacterium]
MTDRISYYFKREWKILLIIAVSGIIYNLGILAGPLFEGKMTGCLVDILGGNAGFSKMIMLVVSYVVVIAVVQISRYIKRFYVRRFSNNVNKRMKSILYKSLVNKSKTELEQEGVGDVMTKAILDVDDCAEGMRKFTTEIFDTGIALSAYAGMLLYYDWRLALISMIFPPISYFIAEKMKKVVQKTGTTFKEQAGILSMATLDRASNALTYRIYGCEQERKESYEKNLSAYEKSAVRANIWGTALPPVYRVISMAGVLFILYYGSKNVLGTGWKLWDIAVFTTFLSCFTKLSEKSSHAANLFNAVHKAQVSWKRIKPLLKDIKYDNKARTITSGELTVSGLGFSYPDGGKIFSDVTFSAKPGQIVGITGAVASGKSTLGKTFLCEYPYEGSIYFDGTELRDMDSVCRAGLFGYLGHDPELFNDSIRNNVLMGDEGDVWEYLRAVCLDGEVKEMEQGCETVIGSTGIRLSGGQAQRLALARTICHKRPVIILDDPFSALDRDTENKVFDNLRRYAGDSIIIIISHRLYLFSEFDKVIWMENGRAVTGTHDEIMSKCSEYADLYKRQ